MSIVASDENLDNKTDAIRRKCKRMVDRIVALKTEPNIPPTVQLEIDVLIEKFRACEKDLAEKMPDQESSQKVVFELIKLIVEAYRIALKLGP